MIEHDQTVNEVWRSISGYLNYQVSKIDRSRNSDTGHIMTNPKTRNGYYGTMLRKGKHVASC